LWAGFVSILIGLLALTIDRQLAHFIYDHVSARAHKALDSITHYAKGGHWLAPAILALIVGGRHAPLWRAAEESTQLINYSLAFYRHVSPWAARPAACHQAGLGPGAREIMEMGLYGFQAAAFKSHYNSFSQRHA
jgi:hypothetical protein